MRACVRACVWMCGCVVVCVCVCVCVLICPITLQESDRVLPTSNLPYSSTSSSPSDNGGLIGDGGGSMVSVLIPWRGSQQITVRTNLCSSRD